jgi:hypothetical protein
MTTWHSISAKIGINFADKRRSLGRYSRTQTMEFFFRLKTRRLLEWDSNPRSQRTIARWYRLQINLITRALIQWFRFQSWAGHYIHMSTHFPVTYLAKSSHTRQWGETRTWKYEYVCLFVCLFVKWENNDPSFTMKCSHDNIYHVFVVLLI